MLVTGLKPSEDVQALIVRLSSIGDVVHTLPALAAGVAINPGPEWSVNKERARSRLRLCFANLSHEEIHQGVAALAEVCKREFGTPAP